jgi:hypothetical protein
MQQYRFYGWQGADVLPTDKRYQAVGTPRQLYNLMDGIWCRYSCAPRYREQWSEHNKTLGQCSITAFLVQDIYGGKVYGVPLEDGAFHCYNDVNGCVFDLTSEQFGDKVLSYEGNPEQLREVQLAPEEKRLRYEYLVAALDKALSKA